MSEDSPVQPGFNDLGLSAPVLKGLDEIGYEVPSSIQAQTIPHLMAGSDLVGQAQTGTGKTAAFALPLLSRLDMTKAEPQILVLVPTRELAIQVSEAFQKYAAHIPGFHVLPVYGGQAYGGQLRSLKRGTHVLVGTPGRLCDHVRRGTIDLKTLTSLVIDEADEMLRMGFIEEVEWILEQTDPTRQIALFSATMPDAIRRIALRHLKDPVQVTIKTTTSTASTIRQRFWMVSGLHKLDALTRILEGEELDGMIIFVRTKTATVELATKLEARGFSCAALNGDIPQAQREETVDKLREGKIDVLVATDVAARGLDVKRLSHVINYDIPNDVESYIHRIGRTGRAGRTGEAILFVAPRERRLLQTIERATNQKIEAMQLPTVDTINDLRVTRFKQRITDTLALEGLESFQQLVDDYCQEHNISVLEVAGALAKIVQGEAPLLLKPEAEQPTRDREPMLMDVREARPKPVRRNRDEGVDDGPMKTYALNVGYDHGVKPGQIVGAIANEGGLDGHMIRRIEIYDEFTTVQLPASLSFEQIATLKKTRVCGRPLKITLLEEGEEEAKSAGWKKDNRPAAGAPPKREYKKDFNKGPGGFKKPRRDFNA